MDDLADRITSAIVAVVAGLLLAFVIQTVFTRGFDWLHSSDDRNFGLGLAGLLAVSMYTGLRQLSRR